MCISVVCGVQKFYKTLSEIMPDVTYVVKTGRQVVERKQVDFPGVLTSQIDAIKQHFNDLGAQVLARRGFSSAIEFMIILLFFYFFVYFTVKVQV